MNKTFKQYHEHSILITRIPIYILNKICTDFYDGQFYYYTRIEDERISYDNFKNLRTDCESFEEYCNYWYSCKMSVKNPTNLPSNAVLGDILGVKVCDIYWDDSGFDAIIKYRIKG